MIRTIEEPYYMVNFSASFCNLEILVNDVPALSIELDGQTSTMVPINHLILESGKQEISIKISPLEGEIKLHQDAVLKFNIYLFEAKGGLDFRKQLNEYKSPSENVAALPLVKHKEVFNAKVPYILDSWQDSIKLKESKSLNEDVIGFYQYVQNLIRNKKYDDFMSLYEAKEANVAKSMYLTEQEKNNRLERLINDFRNGFEVQELPEESILQFQGYNKVVSLVNAMNGRPALFLENKDTEEELYLEVYLHKRTKKAPLSIV